MTMLRFPTPSGLLDALANDTAGNRVCGAKLVENVHVRYGLWIRRHGGETMGRLCRCCRTKTRIRRTDRSDDGGGVTRLSSVTPSRFID